MLRKTMLTLLLVAGAATFATGCTEMCEDDCEEQHDINSCAEGDEDCMVRVGQELLTCVQACNE
ncbi:MAG: hypothetical protein RLO52_05010 [Sandaracinaceae bacterium]